MKNYLDERLKFFIKSILNINIESDILFIKDSNFKYIYANEIFCNLFNINAADIIGKGDEVFIFDKKVLKKCFESDKATYEKDFIIHEENVFNQRYEVLKLKINLGERGEGILCFAKLGGSSKLWNFFYKFLLLVNI